MSFIYNINELSSFSLYYRGCRFASVKKYQRGFITTRSSFDDSIILLSSTILFKAGMLLLKCEKVAVDLMHDSLERFRDKQQWAVYLHALVGIHRAKQRTGSEGLVAR